MQIRSGFDSGNIEVLHQPISHAVDLAIRPDAGGEFLQWFHFRVDGSAGTDCTFRITNAGETSYTKGWENYQVCTSTDRENWFRVPRTTFENGVLEFHHTPEADLQWYAYFAPYSYERHLDLLSWAQEGEGVQVDSLGLTLDGRDMHRIQVGEGPLPFWIIGRQHPGETMASWWMEGFLGRLLDPADPIARALLASSTLHIIPHMNPDGGSRGHLRTNAVGANLNREWDTPTPERSPEVLVTRNAMDESGVAFCLDVHGDEALPYVFLNGPGGIVGYEEYDRPRLCEIFADAYERANPDMQQKIGYPPTPKGKANLSMCTNAVAARYNCPAFTLEMPFKDNANAPDERMGWSPQRSEAMGASALDALWALAQAIES